MSAASSSPSAENKRKSAPLSQDGDRASETADSVAAAPVVRRRGSKSMYSEYANEKADRN
jgi:hypothetical protein